MVEMKSRFGREVFERKIFNEIRDLRSRLSDIEEEVIFRQGISDSWDEIDKGLGVERGERNFLEEIKKW